MDLHFTLKFAEQLAVKTGEQILEKQKHIKIIAFKDRQDIVTNADLDAEQSIIRKIKGLFPSHRIYSEEEGSVEGSSEYEWIIDPIDGTKEFVRGLPSFSTCFALEKNGQAILSVLYEPVARKLYSAAKNIGAYEDGKKVNVNAQSSLENSFVYAYLPHHQYDAQVAEKLWNAIEKLSRKTYRIRGIAAEALAMCWVASGKIEAFISQNTFAGWYDIIPGLFIAKEAGATVTGIDGNKFTKDRLSNGFIISNGKIHSQLIKIMK